jgi:hypothetical protein
MYRKTADYFSHPPHPNSRGMPFCAEPPNEQSELVIFDSMSESTSSAEDVHSVASAVAVEETDVFASEQRLPDDIYRLVVSLVDYVGIGRFVKKFKPRTTVS